MVALYEPVETRDEDEVVDVERHVMDMVDSFFDGRMMHCGGRIPRRLLRDPARVDRIFSCDMLTAIDAAYQGLRERISPEEENEAHRTGASTPDVKLVTETLNLLARSFVPRQFAGGMLLTYLELVEGVNVQP